MYEIDNEKIVELLNLSGDNLIFFMLGTQQGLSAAKGKSEKEILELIIASNKKFEAMEADGKKNTQRHYSTNLIELIDAMPEFSITEAECYQYYNCHNLEAVIKLAEENNDIKKRRDSDYSNIYWSDEDFAERFVKRLAEIKKSETFSVTLGSGGDGNELDFWFRGKFVYENEYYFGFEMIDDEIGDKIYITNSLGKSLISYEMDIYWFLEEEFI